jgi:hypothetical protein
VGAYNTLRDTLVLLISPMGREVAATFLPHPAPGMQQSISEESSPDSSKRDFRGDRSRTSRRKQ